MRLHEHMRSKPSAMESRDQLKKYISETLVSEGFGIHDAEDKEIQLVIDTPSEANYIFADMVSRRAQIGWSTQGHSAVDVNIYGSSGSEDLRGNHENTDIGKFLREYLDVDVDAVTKELREKMKNDVIAAPDVSPGEGIRDVSNHYHSFPGEVELQWS
jgi:alkaline phosphatase